MTKKWGTRRGFIKLHVGVDARTKKIYAVAITDDKCGDSPQFEELVEQAFANAEESPNAAPLQTRQSQATALTIPGRSTGTATTAASPR